MGYNALSLNRDGVASEFQIPSRSTEFGNRVRRPRNILVMEEGSDQVPEESLEGARQHAHQSITVDLRSRLGRLSEAAWGGGQESAEVSGQVSLVVETHINRHLRRRLTCQEATSCFVDSFADQIPMRRYPELTGEASNQVGLAPPEFKGDFLEAMTLEQSAVQESP